MPPSEIDVQVDVWLRGENVATTRPIPGVLRPPSAWVDEDVRTVLLGMLRVMHTLKHPDEGDRVVALRGLSWIVNPYEDGGVVIAIEITLGAAIAGPFDIEKSALEAMITRVLQNPAPAGTSDRIH
jgi:hypothetical protein